MDHTKQLEEAFRYVDQHFDNMLGEVQTACSFRSVASDKAGIEGAASYILQTGGYRQNPFLLPSLRRGLRGSGGPLVIAAI